MKGIIIAQYQDEIDHWMSTSDDDVIECWADVAYLNDLQWTQQEVEEYLDSTEVDTILLVSGVPWTRQPVHIVANIKNCVPYGYSRSTFGHAVNLIKRLA
uniref:Uncharacterized protein n=1 Tax=viral metagenome TaxID=1070528 RepID=A0A2V0R9X1_9ZZZZ